ncbi:MAG TPA: VWA domain-containing protein, partial [Anaerolineae bacterium]|nr:VWA domain-containing protein [Anaerolineae bacterium]
MAHPGSTPAQQLAQFERLLDQADPERPADLARLEATLLRLLERLAARRRPLPVRSDRERIDARATLREYLRQGEFLSRLVYRERPRQRQLVILVDLSESFGPFALWGAAVAVAAKRVAPGVAIWGFGAGLWPLEAECADLASFMAAYRRLRGRSRLSLAGLP